MAQVKPIYIIALGIALLFVIYIKISNPYREYSTSSFWESANIDSVSEIPEEALMPGNGNGPVVMWAAIGSNNPKILTALKNRGVDINESDGVFKGTPLTGAAGYSKNPKMLIELVGLGADIHKTVHNDETALMIAAQYNQTPLIITTLIKLGANLEQKNKNGKTALDLAIRNKNNNAVEELESFANK